MTFAEWFTAELDRHDYGERQFAKNIGVSHTTVRGWKAKTIPGRANCAKIAKGLRVELNEVLERAKHIDDADRPAPEYTYDEKEVIRMLREIAAVDQPGYDIALGYVRLAHATRVGES